MLHFTLNARTGEFPANTAIAVDPKQRKLIRGETYAFRDPDGDFFLARINSVPCATRVVVDRARCQVVGRVVSWQPTMH